MWNTILPDCQSPIGADHTRQQGLCSLLPLKKQTLLPWNTCCPPASPQFSCCRLTFMSLFSLSCHRRTYFYSLFFPVLVSCVHTSAFSHKAGFPLMFSCVVLHPVCNSQVRGHVRETTQYLTGLSLLLLDCIAPQSKYFNWTQVNLFLFLYLILLLLQLCTEFLVT